jgi:hypothetical protein
MANLRVESRFTQILARTADKKNRHFCKSLDLDGGLDATGASG